MRVIASKNGPALLAAATSKNQFSKAFKKMVENFIQEGPFWLFFSSKIYVEKYLLSLEN